ncbi:MAG: signal peptidase II [Anaerolineae bacterium]|nr:signal peptidase II [Anaerolineae bacterium]
MFKKGWWVLPLVTVLLLVVDQASKFIVVSSLDLYEAWAPIPALAHIFEIHPITNTGAAFGLFQNGSTFFVIVSFIVSIIILYYYIRLPAGKWLIRLSMALQLAGAVGNLIDRLRIGHVIDFLDFHFWPVFNVADMCIVCGVFLLGIILLREDILEPQATQTKSAGEQA